MDGWMDNKQAEENVCGDRWTVRQLARKGWIK